MFVLTATEMIDQLSTTDNKINFKTKINVFHMTDIGTMKLNWKGFFFLNVTNYINISNFIYV